jgi:hypothetical protein
MPASTSQQLSLFDASMGLRTSASAPAGLTLQQLRHIFSLGAAEAALLGAVAANGSATETVSDTVHQQAMGLTAAAPGGPVMLTSQHHAAQQLWAPAQGQPLLHQGLQPQQLPQYPHLAPAMSAGSRHFVADVLALLDRTDCTASPVLTAFRDLLESSGAAPNIDAATFVSLLHEAASRASLAAPVPPPPIARPGSGRSSGSGGAFLGQDGMAALLGPALPDGRRLPAVRTTAARNISGGGFGGGAFPAALPSSGGSAAAPSTPPADGQPPTGTPLTPQRAFELATARAALLRLMSAAHAMVSSEAFSRLCAAVGPVLDLYDSMRDSPVHVKRRRCAKMAALRDRAIQDPRVAQVSFSSPVGGWFDRLRVWAAV